MLSQEKILDMFGKAYHSNDQGEVGRLYINREAQKFFAVKEQESRLAIQGEFSKDIAKGLAALKAKGVSTDTPLFTSPILALKAVAKYDDSKIDAAKLVAAIKAEFKCSEDRAKTVVAASRVRPEKVSLVINRLD